MWRDLEVAGASLFIRALRCRIRDVCFCGFDVLFFVWGFLFSDFGGRDAMPYIPRVRDDRCPASALKCCRLGPLGDASGSFSLVLASVCGSFVSVVGFMYLLL